MLEVATKKCKEIDGVPARMKKMMPPIFDCEKGKVIKNIEGTNIVCCIEKKDDKKSTETSDKDRTKKILIWSAVGLSAVVVTLLAIKAFKKK